MDETTSRPGHIEETPEARPLTPPTMRDNYAGPIPSANAGGPSSGQQANGGGAGAAPEDRVEEIGREVAERLKPVAAVAEEVAAKALDLSAKGLSRLAGKLEERRKQRDG